MAATSINYAGSSAHHAVRTRALSVVGAVIGAVAVWVIAVPLLGNHLLIRFGTGAEQSIGLDFVVGASLLGSLAGWGLLTLMERRVARARVVWSALAIVVLAISLSLPFVAGTTTATKVSLALMHVTVAAILIPGLTRGSSAQRNS